MQKWASMVIWMLTTVALSATAWGLTNDGATIVIESGDSYASLDELYDALVTLNGGSPPANFSKSGDDYTNTDSLTIQSGGDLTIMSTETLYMDSGWDVSTLTNLSNTRGSAASLSTQGADTDALTVDGTIQALNADRAYKFRMAVDNTDCTMDLTNATLSDNWNYVYINQSFTI